MAEGPHLPAGDTALIMRDRSAVGIALVFATIAAGLSLWAASPYPGATVDSGEYLAVADGLANGHGLSMPYVSYDESFRILEPGDRVQMTQFPPLYPTALAAIHRVTGFDLLDSAAVLGSACFFLTVLLACLMVWDIGRDERLVALVGLLLLASQLVTLHAMVWSEAPMILALTCALFLTQRAIRTGDTRFLVGASVCAIAASMTRYVGISVAISIGLVSLGRFSRYRAGALVLLSFIPIAAWFVRNAIVSGAVSEKTFAWHPPTGKHFVQGAQAIGGWMVPGAIPAGIAGALVALAVLVWGVRKLSSNGTPLPPALRTCALFTGGYLAVVLLSRTFLDQNIPFDPRILAPLQVLAIVSVCVAIAQQRAGRKKAIVIAIVLVAGVSVVRGIYSAAEFRRLPVAGYTGEAWRGSETLAYVDSLPGSVAIVTNTPDPIWIWHRRASHFLPPRSSLYSGEANENYSQQLQDLREAVSCGEAEVVYFDQPTRKPARSIDPVIVDELGLELKADLSDGGIYEITPAPCVRGTR